MAYTKITTSLLLLLLSFAVSGQAPSAGQPPVYGNWKCVRKDYRGYQKFSLQQAEKIRKATLRIEKTTFSFRDIKFIEPCVFAGWKRSKYDTSEYTSLALVYTKIELTGIQTLEPVDAKGHPACFNECAIFYLKQDTLINICGGYTYYRVRSRDQN
jgi:hypothetical protein